MISELCSQARRAQDYLPCPGYKGRPWFTDATGRIEWIGPVCLVAPLRCSSASFSSCTRRDSSCLRDCLSHLSRSARSCSSWALYAATLVSFCCVHASFNQRATSALRGLFGEALIINRRTNSHSEPSKFRKQPEEYVWHLCKRWSVVVCVRSNSGFRHHVTAPHTHKTGRCGDSSVSIFSSKTARIRR